MIFTEMVLCFHIRPRLFWCKTFFVGKCVCFSMFVCNPENGSKNIFQRLTYMKNYQMFLIFSYNLRSCEKDEKTTNMSCRQG